MKPPTVGSLAERAEELAAITDPAGRRAARIGLKDEALVFRRSARRFQTNAKLADAFAKFGGGSLLTATLLLIVGGQASAAILGIAALTLLMFVAGTMYWMRMDMRAAQQEFEAERLEALLKETER
ncbi:hypothetical protein [Sphingomonas jatrophae]|uniref:Uncharacterized protein n=1 Tax=Sphingomonas jatrophae TaxID=1166337 RepID=A0A1I6L4Q4_9SPHN|nr:hypothetical protein [Sphingomonas jatrophae]SFR98414.1 hypothetical protein SAMN05192580_2284 [Sphingomonas jatrophae]